MCTFKTNLENIEPGSLYERIGGDAAVRATVAKLYEKVLSDALLIPFFAEANVDQLRRSQAGFVTMAFGGPNHYQGKSMRTAHASLVERGLSDVHFDAVAGHLKAAMEELTVPAELIAEALAVVETTRDDVLNR